MACKLSTIILLIASSTFYLRTGHTLFQTKITTKLLPKGSLHVQFDTHKYNYTLYSLELLKSTSEYDDCLDISESLITQATVPGKDPVTEIDIPGPFSTGIYCIRVNPAYVKEGGSCDMGCRTVATRLTINTTDVGNCYNWTANYRMEPTRNNQGNFTMRVYVSLNSTFLRCFAQINISLWFGSNSSCDKTTGFEIDSKLSPIMPDNYSVAVFDDLPAGNYCTRLYGRSPYCSGLCNPLFTSVEIVSDPEVEYRVPEAPAVQIWPYVLGIGLITSLLVVTFVLLYKCRKQVLIGSPFSPNHPRCQKTDELELVLLYSPDFNEHVDVVSSLHKFLLKCCGFKKIRFNLDEEHIIAIDIPSWVENITDVNSKRRFIIVESEGWVLQEEGRKRLKVLERIEGDSSDTAFIYAIETLKTSKKAVNWDYGYVFVVKFEYTPESMSVKSFVPKRRFSLPRQLFDLYHSLCPLPYSDLAENRQFESDMNTKWKLFLEEELNPKVEACKLMLRENPDLVRKSFTEQELYSTAE